YSSALGFGFVIDYGMDMALIHVSLSVFSPKNQDSEEMTNSLSVITGSYIKQFGNLFAGGGGGFARDAYDGDVESGSTSVMIVEGVVWYAIGNNNRIKGKLMIPVGSENVSSILSLGYEYVF
ncbi:hypothetical protein ACFL4W_04810, partial [Planctomycetota bacterium]